MPSVIRPSFDRCFQSRASVSIGDWSAIWVSGMPCGQPQECRARMPTSASARISASAWAVLRTLWHQECTVVMPELIASAAERRVLWKMSSGRHLRAEARHGREIALLGLVAGEAAIERVPHVPVGLDETGHDDHAVAVDPQAAARHVLADRDDVAVAHMDGRRPRCRRAPGPWSSHRRWR